MQIEVTEKSLKALSSNLRNALTATWGPTSSLSHSQSMELLAKTLGYKNWDTLSGVVQKTENKALSAAATPACDKLLESFKPFKLYIGAFSVDEFGEGPGWGMVEVTPAFIKELLDAQELVRSKKLDHVAVDAGPDDWGNADTLRLRGDELVVTRDSFWFKAYPKHCDYSVETRMIDIALLCNVIRDARTYSNDYCAFADDVLFYDGAGAKSFALGLLDDDVVDVNEGTIDQMPS